MSEVVPVGWLCTGPHQPPTVSLVPVGIIDEVFRGECHRGGDPTSGNRATPPPPGSIENLSIQTVGIVPLSADVLLLIIKMAGSAV